MYFLCVAMCLCGQKKHNQLIIKQLKNIFPMCLCGQKKHNQLIIKQLKNVFLGAYGVKKTQSILYIFLQELLEINNNLPKIAYFTP
jgi:hypothetical protein